MYTNVLNLEESIDGNRIKQGDLSVMRYILTDANSDDLQLEDKQAKVYLTDVDGVKYIYDTTVKEQDGKYLCDVIINTIIPAGTYTLEIWVDNTYCFPSDRKNKIKIEKSVLGSNLEDIQSENMYREIIEYAITHGYFQKDEPEDTSKIAVGKEEPEDKTKIWIDTNGGNQ